MAWEGRTDLQKMMRLANDRIRALEKQGLTSTPAYQEAVRTVRTLTGDASVTTPRFTSKGISEKKLTKEINKFLNLKTSTKRGVQSQVKKTIKTIEQRTGKKLTKADAGTIGNIWQGIRKSHGRYNAAVDQTAQEIILKGVEQGIDQDAVADFVVDMLNNDIPLDQWETMFDDQFGDY